jgi:hypothetical protein
MAKNFPTVERSGNTVTVVAPTAAEAMAIAGDAAGPGFRTTSIDKVRRGGMGGFFATEVVRLVAEAQPTPGAPRPLELASADDLLASLCGTEGPFAGRLAEGLQRSLAEPIVAPAQPLPITTQVPVTPPAQPTSAAPAVAAASITTWNEAAPVNGTPHPSANGTHAVTLEQPAPPARSIRPAPAAAVAQPGLWSAEALRSIGLPETLVAETARQQPDSDVTWNVGLMLALQHVCSTDIPPGAVMIGPACADLARRLRVISLDAGELGNTVTSVAIADATPKRLAHGLNGRSVHLVVGGSWRHLATVRPDVVSAATPSDLIDAVRVAGSWGARLGWVQRGDRHVRIDPFLVAGYIRDLLAGNPDHDDMALHRDGFGQ